MQHGTTVVRAIKVDISIANGVTMTGRGGEVRVIKVDTFISRSQGNRLMVSLLEGSPLDV